MRTFSDEEVMAYVDRELEEPLSSELRSAAATDADLRRRIGIFEGSRRLLENVFQSKRSEPVPEHLLRVFHLRTQQQDQQRSNAIRQLVARRNRRVPLAMAASALLALIVGLFLVSQRRAAVSVAYIDSPEVLSAALEKSPSGVPYATDVSGVHHEVVALSSLQLQDGTWCREFDSAQFGQKELHRSRGVACRNPTGQWIARAITPASNIEHAQGSYELASGPSMESAVGPAKRLSPGQELEAIANQWKPND